MAPHLHAVMHISYVAHMHGDHFQCALSQKSRLMVPSQLSTVACRPDTRAHIQAQRFLFKSSAFVCSLASRASLAFKRPDLRAPISYRQQDAEGEISSMHHVQASDEGLCCFWPISPSIELFNSSDSHTLLQREAAFPRRLDTGGMCVAGSGGRSDWPAALQVSRILMHKWMSCAWSIDPSEDRKMQMRSVFCIA